MLPAFIFGSKSSTTAQRLVKISDLQVSWGVLRMVHVTYPSWISPNVSYAHVLVPPMDKGVGEWACASLSLFLITSVVCNLFCWKWMWAVYTGNPACTAAAHCEQKWCRAGRLHATSLVSKGEGGRAWAPIVWFPAKFLSSNNGCPWKSFLCKLC